MLFGYPIAAVENNWLNECICSIITTIHTEITANSQWEFNWNSVLPMQYRSELQRKHGLQSRFSKYVNQIRSLKLRNLDLLVSAIATQNNIHDLLLLNRDYTSFESLPKRAAKALQEIFLFAYDLLTDLSIRDQQYRIIYEQIRYKVCPFCGLEPFDAPDEPRHDLDHYLLKDKYPFAAANLHNLVPACSRCNKSYKLMKDVLHNSSGTRRRAFYPYSDIHIQVSLNETDPFGTDNPLSPQWVIRLEPETEETITWDEVYNIRERYTQNVLDKTYRNWLDEFKSWNTSTTIQCTNATDLSDALNRYCQYLQECGYEDRAFLRHSVFQMLLSHCQRENLRVQAFLLDLLQDT
jgi:hypothetical protein